MNELKRLPVLVAALALVGFGGAARAQDEETLPRTWSLKVGAFISNNGGMKDQAGDTWYYVGADFFPNFKVRPLRGDIHIGLDAAFRGAGGADFHSVSLSGKLIWPITDPSASQYHVYGGFGLGLYFISTAFLSDLTTVGGKFILGVDITNRYFIEFNYDYVSGFTDNLGNALRADGVTIAGGVRF